MLSNPLPDPLTQEEKIERVSSKQQKANIASDQVGQQLRAMRKARRLSIRSLAQLSGLSINTLSLIEKGKTSPSVNTLHQLAQSLKVPITAFFESEQDKKRIAYQRAGERQQLIFSQGHMESLSAGLPRIGSEPFITRLEPGANSGTTPVVYAGREFIYCLEGQITYSIEGKEYPLDVGDSLIFDAHMPHTWRNTAPANSRALLVLCPDNSFGDFSERSFMP
jgi:transcriptional regulator with XRE-family HTH domain